MRKVYFAGSIRGGRQDAALYGEMIAFLKANTASKMKPGLQKCRSQVRIVVGAKEEKRMLYSAQRVHEMLRESTLETKKSLFHGEYSINYPDLYVADLYGMIRKRRME